MRNIAFIVAIAVLLCGCAGLLYSPLPGENPTASTEVGLSVMTPEAPNRDIEYRPYHDFLQFVNGPDVKGARAIVDTVLRRRGYELRRRRSAMSSESTTGIVIPIPGPVRSSVGLCRDCSRAKMTMYGLICSVREQRRNPPIKN